MQLLQSNRPRISSNNLDPRIWAPQTYTPYISLKCLVQLSAIILVVLCLSSIFLHFVPTWSYHVFREPWSFLFWLCWDFSCPADSCSYFPYVRNQLLPCVVDAIIGSCGVFFVLRCKYFSSIVFVDSSLLAELLLPPVLLFLVRFQALCISFPCPLLAYHCREQERDIIEYHFIDFQTKT